MSPQRMDSNFEGLNALPVTMRHQRGPLGQDYHPWPTDAEDINEHRETLGCDRRPALSWGRPANPWGPGWEWDDVLLCHRWADDLLSEPERECVARAREACALEEART